MSALPHPTQHAPIDSVCPSTRGRQVAAWAVHGFTLTGAVWASLAALALFEGRITMMWLWLGIALVVDGVDGTLARKVNVLQHAPMFDGRTLDNIVDYLTWSFIPALFMYKYIPLGTPLLTLILFVLVAVSSLFCYCNLSLKTDDCYFMGFPAAWNIAAVFMWILGTNTTTNVVATVVLAALTVSPLTFVHPFRVRQAMPVNIVAAITWLMSTVALVIHHPDRPVLAWALWWASLAWLGGLSAIRTVVEIRSRRHAKSLVSARG